MALLTVKPIEVVANEARLFVVVLIKPLAGVQPVPVQPKVLSINT